MRTAISVGHVILLVVLSASVVMLYGRAIESSRRLDHVTSLVWEHQDSTLQFADSHNGQLTEIRQRLEELRPELSDMRSKLDRGSYAHKDVADALEAAAKQIRIRR